MTLITKDEIRKLAHMSQLEIPDDQLEYYRADLEAVLNYASGLKAIADQYQTVQPMPKNSNVMREDIVIPTIREPLLALAPEREEDYFVVPKIIKHG